MFEEPEDWKKTLESEVTLETKVPPRRKKEDLKKKPQREDLNKKLDKKNELIKKKRKEIDALYKEKDQIRDEEKKKSNEGYNQFIELKDVKEKAWAKLSAAREKFNWKNLRTNQNKARDKLRTIMDKSPFKGIAKNTAQAQKYIARLKQEFRDKKKTAKEEKAMNEKIKKYEDGLVVFEKVDKLHAKLDDMREKMNTARDQIKPLEREYDAAKKKLNKNHEEFKKKKEEELEKNGGAPVEKDSKEKKERKERVLTPAEKEIVKKVEKKREEINKIRKEKDALFEEFDKQMMEFRMDHFEFAKENLTFRILKRLKHEESQRKWEEDKKKREEERLQRLKDERKEIFTKEMEEINSVNGALQLLKLDRDRGSMIGQPSKAQVDANDLGELNIEDENLQLMEKKKSEGYNYKPVSKKQSKRKRNRKKEKVNIAQLPSQSASKSLLPPDISLILKQMKVEEPADLSKVDEVIKAVSAKREYYLQLRDRYVNEEKFEGEEAEIVKRGEMFMNVTGEAEEGEVREVKEKKPKGKKKREKKPVEASGDEFPTL